MNTEEQRMKVKELIDFIPSEEFGKGFTVHEFIERIHAMVAKAPLDLPTLSVSMGGGYADGEGILQLWGERFENDQELEWRLEYERLSRDMKYHWTKQPRKR